MTTTIAIIGDFDSANKSHTATQDSIGHVSKGIGAEVQVEWIGTEQVAGVRGLERLTSVSGVWIAPASPYRSMEGALAAIRLARQNKIPLLGTCGGFQHVIIDYARNVLGIVDAGHEEVDAGAERLVISRLSCSLVGRTGTVRFEPGSLVQRAYGCGTAQEQYWCNFGINPAFEERFRFSELHLVGRDKADDAVRAVELAGHPFFVGTLFLPQLGSNAAAPHPLIAAFVRACCGKKSTEANNGNEEHEKQR